MASAAGEILSTKLAAMAASDDLMGMAEPEDVQKLIELATQRRRGSVEIQRKR